MAARVRQDVAKLATWDPVLLWYARAVARMRERPLDDPLSWRYQAAIHDYVPGEDDPLSVPGERAPSTADQRRFWRQCQHFSWFFLPWHRMFLFHFERIVASAVVEVGGPAGWALPYWNYSAPGGDARRLPAAFRERSTPDNLPNPLRVEDRASGSNEGSLIADEEDVDLVACLREPQFVAQGRGGNPGFGGPRTNFNHSGGRNAVVGKLERIPHGVIHGAVGGWMGFFNTAGLDPLFWLHHANIDRLWTVWQRRNSNHRDPDEPRWLTSVRFEFHDETGSIVSHTASEVIDSRVAPLEYDYEDVSDPIADIVEAVVTRREEQIPEMVGATEEPLLLTGQPATTRMAINPATGPAGGVEATSAGPAEIYLNIENVTGQARPISYGVYVNVPPGDAPEAHPELYAGVLPMFGVAEASRQDEEHSGSGVNYALEIGHIVRALQARNAWNPNDLSITFVPKRKGTAEALEAPAAPIRVGRLSLYYT